MSGNVLDMAVGVVIATAFGKITNSLVSDIIMPVIGKITGGIDLSYLNVVIREAEKSPTEIELLTAILDEIKKK